jgi:F-type H+-transporting ATPase subunit b
MEALANLGIDWKLFLAQAVNFLVLLFVLRRFAYKPMLEFLDKRRGSIEQGLKDAEIAKTKLAQMEVKKQETLVSARKEARDIVAAAEISAKQRDAERLAETEIKTKRLIADELVKIEEEKHKAFSEVREEIADLVAVAVEKILKEKVDTAKDKELIENVVVNQYAEALQNLLANVSQARAVSVNQNPAGFSKIRSEEKKLGAVVKHLEKIDAEKEGRVSVTVVTANEVVREMKDKMEKQAAKLFPDKKIELHYEVDHNVIGGILFRTDEALYDETISGKLQALKNSFLKA